MLMCNYIWTGSRTQVKVLAGAQLPTCDSNAAQQHFKNKVLRQPAWGRGSMSRKQSCHNPEEQGGLLGGWKAAKHFSGGKKNSSNLWQIHGEVPVWLAWLRVSSGQQPCTTELISPSLPTPGGMGRTTRRKVKHRDKNSLTTETVVVVTINNN